MISPWHFSLSFVADTAVHNSINTFSFFVFPEINFSLIFAKLEYNKIARSKIFFICIQINLKSFKISICSVTKLTKLLVRFKIVSFMIKRNCSEVFSEQYKHINE